MTDKNTQRLLDRIRDLEDRNRRAAETIIAKNRQISALERKAKRLEQG